METIAKIRRDRLVHGKSIYVLLSCLKDGGHFCPAEARTLVSEACEHAVNSRRQLLEILAGDSRQIQHNIDWQSLAEASSKGLSDVFIQQVLASIWNFGGPYMTQIILAMLKSCHVM